MSQQELTYQEKTVGQISELSKFESAVQDKRVQELQTLLTHINVLHLSTSKVSKAEAFLQLIEK